MVEHISSYSLLRPLFARKPFHSTIGSLWAQVPQGPQRLSSGILSRISLAGGGQEGAYFVTHTLIPNSAVHKAHPCKVGGGGGVAAGSIVLKVPSLGHTRVNRGSGSLPQDDPGILVHSGARCLLRAGMDAFRTRMEEQNHLQSW